jgi:hypothetical protein
MIQYTVSLGDMVVVVVAIFSIGVNYAHINQIDYKVEELRRGRGIILEHFPPMVRRCFGYTTTQSGE